MDSPQIQRVEWRTPLMSFSAKERRLIIDALNDAAENVVNASEALGEGHGLEDDLRDDVEQIDALIIALGGEPQDRGL